MTRQVSSSMAIVGAQVAFRAMGCRVSVIVNGSPVLLARARSRIEHLERLWSRFIDDSDISSLNRSSSRPRHVDPITVRLIRAMIDGWAATDGAFDPTLLPSLLALGHGGQSGSSKTHVHIPYGSSWRGDPAAIHIDGDRVTLPAGTTLDAGGIGKGMAADIVAEELLDAGAEGALVDIGGDIAVRGAAPSSAGWRIAVGNSDEIIALSCGGVATSGTERRAWTGPDGQAVHHLIDPCRLTSFDTSVREATVIAGTAAWAEVFTKYLLAASAASVQKLEEALAHLAGLGLAARVRHHAGAVECNEAWPTFAVAQGAS